MKLSHSLFLLAGLAGALGAPAQAATLFFSPVSFSVVLGSQATVDVVVQGLGNGAPPALAGYDLTVLFDPTVLAPNSVAFSNRLGDPTDPSQVITSNSSLVGGINLAAVSLLNGPQLQSLQTTSSSGFTLATLTFDTLAVATGSQLSFTVASAVDENLNSLTLDVTAGSFDVTAGGGGAPPSTVPEPASLALGGAGLLALGLIQRLRRA